MIWFHKKKKGFTLLELMIVVIIIGILASLAMPRFIKATKKAKEAEAKAMLGAIRSAQIRYYLEWNWDYHSDSDLSNGSGLDLSITISDYYIYKALDGSADSDAGYPLIGEAEAKTDTGLTTLKIDEQGNME